MIIEVVNTKTFVSKEEHNAIQSDSYGIGKGRMFGDWIEANGRSNGYSEGDLIENPAYIIESILREELKNEYYKTTTANNLLEDYSWTGTYEEYPGGSHYIGGDTLESEVTYPVSLGKYYILKYNQVALDPPLTLLLRNSALDFQQLTNDGINGYKTIIFTPTKDFNYIYFAGMSMGTYEINNITIEEYPAAYNIPIDTDSFDLIGNTTNGTHKDWIFAKSIYNQMPLGDVLSLICYESHLLLTKSYNRFTLKSLLNTNIAGTFQFLIAQRGILKYKLEYTPIDGIYTEFVLNYHYDYGSSLYKKKITVSPVYSSNAALDSYKIILRDNETKYRLKRKWEYSADYIYDESTALLCIENFIKQHISQRIILTFTGDLQYHIRYEIGDQVLVYLPAILPDTVNYSKVFMIFSKKIDINSSTVEFGLIEMADQLTNINITTEVPEDLTTENEDLFFIE